MRHGELSQTETCKIVRQIRCDVFERAIDLVQHALGQIVTRQKTKAFLEQVTIAAWRAQNVPLIHWLHNVHSKATASSFAKCFKEDFCVVQSAPMCGFLSNIDKKHHLLLTRTCNLCSAQSRAETSICLVC